MTKEQLKKELQEKFYRVGLVEVAEENELGYQKRLREGVMWYLVGVYEKKGDVLLRRNIPIYCVLKEAAERNVSKWEDLPEGDYFYGERMPQKHTIPELPKENSFKDVEGEIEKQTKDYAVVKKFVEENGEAVEKRFLVKKVGDKFVEIPIREK